MIVSLLSVSLYFNISLYLSISVYSNVSLLVCLFRVRIRVYLCIRVSLYLNVLLSLSFFVCLRVSLRAASECACLPECVGVPGLCSLCMSMCSVASQWPGGVGAVSGLISHSPHILSLIHI